MSSNSRKKQRKKMEKQNSAVQPWISMKTGRRIIWILSLGLAIFIAWQVIPVRGVPEGILWGLIFGGSIWLIFEGYSRFYRFLRRFH